MAHGLQTILSPWTYQQLPLSTSYRNSWARRALLDTSHSFIPSMIPWGGFLYRLYTLYTKVWTRITFQRTPIQSLYAYAALNCSAALTETNVDSILDWTRLLSDWKKARLGLGRGPTWRRSMLRAELHQWLQQPMAWGSLVHFDAAQGFPSRASLHSHRMWSSSFSKIYERQAKCKTRVSVLGSIKDCSADGTIKVSW